MPPGKEVDWGKLLQESQNDAAHIDTKGIPPILKPLPQLAADARRLAKEHPKEAKMQSQAAILFGKGGVDIEQQPRLLEKDLFRRMDPSREVPTETDLAKCLELKHQTLISSAIEESTKMTENSFRNFYMNKLEDDWDEERKAILEQLGFQKLRPPPDTKPAMHEDTPMSETALVVPSNMTLEQRVYAETVLNLHRTEKETQQRVINTVQAFRQAAIVADQAQDKKFALVQDCWELVAAYVDSLPQPLKPGDKKGLTKNLIRGALRYLEELFIKFRIGSNMQGGSLGFIPKAQSFLKASNTPMGQETWDGSPFWPLVFVCFRCGRIDDALYVAHKGREQGLSVSGTFTKCLEMWKIGKRLDEQLWKELRTEYDNLQGDVDKHKAALFVIVGRFKDMHNSTTFQTVEDYMWFQLHMIWEGEGKLPDWLGIEPRKYSLSYLQETLRSFGVAHFSALYYKVLLLSQQFEQAVCYLVNTDCSALAVHLAIALQRLGLLHCFYDARPDLLSGANTNPKVNFLRIVKGYIEPFKRTNPEEAFMYLLFLRDVDEGDEKERGQGKGLCRREITNLIMQTRDFDVLIGKERPAQINHVVKSGCVYRWCGDDAQGIIIDAGKQSEDKGNVADALKLFSLAEKEDLVAALLIKEMGRVLTHHRDDRDRKELYLRATQFLRTKGQGESEHSRSQIETLTTLVLLTAFFNQCEQRLYTEALTTVRQTSLLPQSIQDIEAKVTLYEGLDKSLNRHMEAVVDAALECLSKQQREGFSSSQATQQASALSAFRSRIYMQPYTPDR